MNAAINRVHVVKAGLAATALVLAVGGYWVDRVAAGVPEAGRAIVRTDGSSVFADVAERVAPAVVFVRTERSWSEGERRRSHPFEFFREFLPNQEETKRERKIPGGGSGFLFDDEGHILTNNHVVKDADDITVIIDSDDGEVEFEAEVVGTDPRSDIAVLKIDAPGGGLPVVPFGDSDALRVGDWVMAIGTPFGQLQGTVTVGIVSAKGRNNLAIVGGEADYQNYIQTDASINFGNSGGPLVDTQGRAVGINTAINPSGQGIGFAIPINMVRNVIQQLLESGKVRYGYIGISFLELDRTLAEGLGLDLSRGVMVREVMKDYPAEKAGLRAKDVILEYDGHVVRDGARFRLMVANTSIGTKVPLVVLRKGQKKKLTLRVGERPDNEVVAAARPARSESWLGIQVDDLGSREGRSMYSIPKGQKGVVVLGVDDGSPASEAGILEGDIITEVYSEAVADLKDYTKIAKKLKDREAPIAFLVKRGKNSSYIPVKPGKR